MLCLEAHIHKGVVDGGAVRQEEAGAGRQLVEHKELHLGAHVAVVTLLGLLQPLQVLCQLLLVREGDPIHSLIDRGMAGVRVAGHVCSLFDYIFQCYNRVLESEVTLLGCGYGGTVLCVFAANASAGEKMTHPVSELYKRRAVQGTSNREFREVKDFEAVVYRKPLESDRMQELWTHSRGV